MSHKILKLNLHKNNSKSKLKEKILMKNKFQEKLLRKLSQMILERKKKEKISITIKLYKKKKTLLNQM